MRSVRIINDEVCFSIRESAKKLGVSYQTIWRYVITKVQQRKIRHYIYGSAYYVPVLELERFKDEIRPKFNGGPGRPKGSKNKTKKKMKTKRADYYEELMLYKDFISYRK